MKQYLDFVKFSHTIFALPFAILGFSLGVVDVYESFPWDKLALIIVCMATGRNAAMGFNRIVDRSFDAMNSRTENRLLASGKMSVSSARWFVVINVLLFLLSTWLLNWTCFFLAPVALFIIMGYSYTKRFTFLCHFILGLGLALAPVGAYVATTGEFSLLTVLYGIGVLCWVSGFDILYALQDEEFDKEQNLKSIPVLLGRVRSMRLSEIMHLISALAILGSAIIIDQTYTSIIGIHWIGAGIFVGLLIYQHLIVSPKNLSRINAAFFTTNGLASLIFGIFVITDLLI